jgi:hypothetical protein
MSRVKIGAVVALVVLVLGGAAYLLATERLEAGIQRDVEARVARAADLVTKISALESLDIITKVQGFARDEALPGALGATERSARDALWQQAVQRFQASAGGGAKPDFLAVVDAKGVVVAADSPLPDSEDLKSRFKSVAAALDGGQVSKDVWSYGKGTVKVGVAPVIDASGERRGAALVGYAISDKEAQADAKSLGTEVVFFAGSKVVASSFARGGMEDVTAVPALRQLVDDTLGGKKAAPVEAHVGGDSYIAAAGLLPLNFADHTSGAIVLESLGKAFEPVATVRYTILLLGLAALLVALLTMFVTARLILHQAEDIEAGVADIINGDVDYSFTPVGADLDGLANGLNVMLARLLGRPEPNEDGVDEASAQGSKVLLEEDAAQPGGARLSNDPEIVALASEPEPQYLRRIYEEYLAARRGLGENVDNVTFESFSAKLRLNEANLKKKYSCKAVRFRVQVKDKQVTLKPVPIL